ncbi:ATP-binding cassette subfamily C protein [Neobacillus bataviensis]|uniref:ATP-binding cassette subfamily C protein n=1 Tax=Neobacillus bataviensis TaxID=220685 RepID=A0A561D6F4_9BACI|nr:ABC transporter ATP-binding protein [Neobacillus bataviensis]TWD98922.1 ATP-binding cassette subfamily C protein [Neobacillus bataviensis]
MKEAMHFLKLIHSFSGKILYINLFAMIIISLFEGVGIYLLLPLINVTKIIDIKIHDSYLNRKILFIFDSIPQTIALTIILTIFVFVIISQSFFQRNQTILNTKIQQGFARKIREETHKLILLANWGFFLKNRKSDLINSMIMETGRVSGGVNLLLNFLSSIVFTLIQIGIACIFSVKMTIFVTTFGLVLVFFLRKFIKQNNKLGKDNIELSQTYMAGISEHINGIKDIKSNNLEEKHISWFKRLNEKMEENVIRTADLKTRTTFIYKVVSACLIGIFVFLSIKLFKGQSASLVLILVIFSRIWPRITGIQSNLEQIGSVLPSFKNLLNLQKECLEYREINEKMIHDVKPMEINKGLECKNVYFKYNIVEKEYALSNVNLQFPVNRMTAIVGPSGAGKSTLIDLLMGLNQPGRGEVLIDGAPLNNEIVLSFRNSLSYVPQDPFLFNTTIRGNLLLIDQKASEEQIWEALRFAAAEDFVKKLPSGLDTLIGDRGIKLSGGERQRLVLARAILRKPSILILDEATSALDTENESKIQEALERLKGTMTIIVIAHRLSTIRNADQVVVLNQGEVIQQGQFNQLAKEKRGMFSLLLKKQLEVSG